MQLERVEIRNFRSIKEATIGFQPHCRVLVGINESGKSNVLEAMALLDSDRKVQKTDIREPLPGEEPDAPGYVAFVFSIDKVDREKFAAAADEMCVYGDPDVPLVGSASIRDVLDGITELVVNVDLREPARQIWTWNMDESTVAPGWYAPNGTAPANTFFEVRSGKSVSIKNVRLVYAPTAEDLPEQYLRPAVIKDVNRLRDAVLRETCSAAIPPCVLWRYSEDNLLPGQIDIDEFSSDSDISVPLTAMFRLAGHTDIGAAIRDAQSKSPSALRNLLARVSEISTRHIRSVWKDYKSIRIDLYPNGEKIDCVVKDHHNVYEFARRSDGFKRFISFLLLVSARHRSKRLTNTLYLHDEPDTGLHPSGARHLRDELIEISRNNYVVYATHSIFMIDSADIGRHLIVSKQGEVTSLTQVQESNIVDEEVIYNALGYSVFEALKQKNIVFEGWRDKALFEAALRRGGSATKEVKEVLGAAGRCHARGVKDIGRIVPMLELANREWLIVSDGDGVAREWQAKYDGRGPWLRYDQLLDVEESLTAEDFVKAPALYAAAAAIQGQLGEISRLTLEALEVPSGRIEVVKAWMARSGIDRERVRTLIDSFKSKVFDHITPGQIEDRYMGILKALSDRIKP